jgi:hypothetical protein
MCKILFFLWKCWNFDSKESLWAGRSYWKTFYQFKAKKIYIIFFHFIIYLSKSCIQLIITYDSHLLIIKPSFSKFGLLYPYIDICFFKIFLKRKQWQNSKLWKCSRYVNYNFKNSYRKLNHISVKLDLKHIS